MNYKLKIAEILSGKIDMEAIEIIGLIETPPNPQMGDYAFPCFKLAKEMRKAPAAIAKDLLTKLDAPDFLDKITTEGPYINFYLNKTIFAIETLKEAAAKGDRYGSSDMGGGGVVIIDFSSPNIAKPFHVGHLRSTVIGHALYNIYNFLGYKSIGINHLGDWGTQFGKLITAYKKWGSKEIIEQDGIMALMDLYVRFHDEAEKDDSLNDEARGWFVKMQEGDSEALSLWKWIYNISIKEFDRVYEMLGVTFDAYTGESFYNDKMEPVINELRDKNLLVESRGAMIVDLEEYNMPPCLIVRKDGGTLYATRDITAALYRKKEYNYCKSLYLTALDQNLHFSQVFRVIEKMGYDFWHELIHVPFGLVSLETGKISTRKGQVVLMEDLLNEAVSKTTEIINERNPELENKEQTARIVGIGAVIFNDLYNGRIKDVVFSWDRILNFYGETGPYVQYTHTRANSVVNKSEDMDFPKEVDFSALTSDNSFTILRQIYDLPEKIIEAAEKNEPSVLSRQLVLLCQSFNKFYNEEPILKAEPSVAAARVLLTKTVRDIIKNMLAILGIEAPERM